MRERRGPWRRWKDRTLRALTFVCVVIALVPLASILWTAAEVGGRAISWNFLTAPESQLENPCSDPGTAHCTYGGIGPAIEATLILLGLATLIAVPIGVGAGIYLAEYGRGRVGRTIEFMVEVMAGIPSMVVGLFVFSLFYFFYEATDPRAVYSAFSGSVALAVIMIPIVTRTSEQALEMVPASLREASLALGIPKHRSTLSIVLSSARAPLTTGALLAAARAGGETAPLLFTAFGNRFGFQGFDQPAGAIPPLIWNWGSSGYTNLITDAWGMALVLIVMMLGISLTARMLLNRTLLPSEN